MPRSPGYPNFRTRAPLSLPIDLNAIIFQEKTLKTLEKETWPFDHAVNQQEMVAIGDVKSDEIDEQTKPGFFNKLRQAILPRIWRTS